MPSSEIFESEYQLLNPQQKLAVDTIDGPVMVIAGAGTGKTQTLSLRVGQILRQTQTNPNNILCLTFTDSAALNMRQRLVKLIGSSSYGVRICTFHAFCNSVIKDYPEYFLFSKRESIPLDDVTQIQIIRHQIDSLPLDSVLRNPNFPYFYQKDIIKNIASLKKENVTPDDFIKLINLAKNFVDQAKPVMESISAIRVSAKTQSDIISQLTSFKSDSVLYQAQLSLLISQFENGSINLSTLKQKARDFVSKTEKSLPKLFDLHHIYQGYQQSLIDRHFYDYDDMILWVITAFKQHPNLVSIYRENYQYIQVDEFQDTNSAQFEIINQLLGDDPNPNIFVVGDDDQSIYRFQGASVENVYTFYQKYQKHIKVLVLNSNYRSQKLILESSNSVISHNLTRISNYITGLNKSLQAASDFDPDPVNLYAAASPIDEQSYLVDQISSLINSKVEPCQIAILVRANADIKELFPILNQRQIKYLISDSTNILDTIEIQQLLKLIKFIFNPDDALLSQVLSFNFVGIPANTLYKLFHRLHRHQSLFELISSSKNKKLKKFSKRVVRIQKLANNSPADIVFNEIIRRFKYLDWVLSSKRIDILKQVNTLYSHLKSLMANEKISLTDWVKRLDILVEDELEIKSPPLLGDIQSSIRLMTVHKAKGLEFDHVFLYKVVSGKWDGGTSRNLINLPLGVIKYQIASSLSGDEEEDRRLFYVALTRARKQIYLTYSKVNDAGKEQLPSLFINEIDPHLVEQVNTSPEVEASSLVSFYSKPLPLVLSPDIIGHVSEYLNHHYIFNITHLNSYLNCPFCFFFKTILKIPQTKTPALSFGTSIHGALNYLYEYFRLQHQLVPLETVIGQFKHYLTRESLRATDFNALIHKGRQVLTKYYQHYQGEFNDQTLNEKDFRLYRVHLDDIPITGKIDRIDILDPHSVNVVDYKTGKPDSKSKQLSPEGDYYRQLVFYKILCSHAHGFNFQVKSGTIDFIETNNKDQFVRKNYLITDEATALLEDQIKTVYHQILNLEFPVSEKCDNPDHFHELSDKYFK